MEYSDTDDSHASMDTPSEAEKMPMIRHTWNPSKDDSRRWLPAQLAGIGLILLLSLAANVAFVGVWLFQKYDLDAICGNHTSAVYSPVMEDVQIQYRPVRFNGSFIEKPIYFQDPSPEVDQAWSGLGIDFRTTVVPEDRGKAAGIDPSAVKVRADQGGGYLTNIEVLHHLHCLNMIRQTLPWNVDYYRDSSSGVYENSEPIVRLHIDHCMDIVRQQLQCSSDIGTFGQRWVQRKGKDLNVFPIFDTVHMCRNFDDILEWARNHQSFDGALAEVRDTDVIMDHYT